MDTSDRWLALDAPAVLGTGSFGGMGSTPEWLGTGLDEAGAHSVLDRGVAVGAVAFDTADSYALGRALCSVRVRRADPSLTAVFLASRVRVRAAVSGRLVPTRRSDQVP
jgi:aryl-alcohol dehydrogenase-like predicted oxidoreductase